MIIWEYILIVGVCGRGKGVWGGVFSDREEMSVRDHATLKIPRYYHTFLRKNSAHLAATKKGEHCRHEIVSTHVTAKSLQGNSWKKSSWETRYCRNKNMTDHVAAMACRSKPLQIFVLYHVADMFLSLRIPLIMFFGWGYPARGGGYYLLQMSKVD